MGQSLLTYEVSRSQNDAPHSVGLLWTSDQLVAETSTWQHTTFATDKHPCPWWDLNPQSQQVSGPQTYALDRAATGTGTPLLRQINPQSLLREILKEHLHRVVVQVYNLQGPKNVSFIKQLSLENCCVYGSSYFLWYLSSWRLHIVGVINGLFWGRKWAEWTIWNNFKICIGVSRRHG